MAMPFYVSPEQLMKDRADFARKGIARGRALIAVAFARGVVFVGENPSSSLYKTSEIYDRIAFAAVGKYSEFEAMRVAGIRLADVKGYQYAREDVVAKSLANAYSQSLGAIFLAEAKPYEVELLIAQVGETSGDEQDGTAPLELYHILYDGSIVDKHRFVAIGGEAEALETQLEERWSEGLDRDGAVAVGVAALRAAAERDIPASDLEVSGLDAGIDHRRHFFRLDAAEVEAATADGGSAAGGGG